MITTASALTSSQSPVNLSSNPIRMEAKIIDRAEPTEELLEVLRQHLPYSLPTLRRIQFMKISSTQDSHVSSPSDTATPGKDFLVAFLYFSKGPETGMWLYSSFENQETLGNGTKCEKQVLDLFREVRERSRSLTKASEIPPVFLGLEVYTQLFLRFWESTQW